MKPVSFIFSLLIVLTFFSSCNNQNNQKNEEKIVEDYMHTLDSLKTARKVAIQDSLNALAADVLFHGVKFGMSEKDYNKIIKPRETIYLVNNIFYPDAYFEKDSLYRFYLRCYPEKDCDESKLLSSIKEILVSKYGDEDKYESNPKDENYIWLYKQRYIYLRCERNASVSDGEIHKYCNIIIEYDYPPYVQAEEKRLKEDKELAIRQQKERELKEKKNESEL